MGIGLGLRTLVEALGTELAYPKESVSYIVKPALASLRDVENMELVNVEKDGRFPLITEAFERLQERFGRGADIGQRPRRTIYDGSQPVWNRKIFKKQR